MKSTMGSTDEFKEFSRGETRTILRWDIGGENEHGRKQRYSKGTWPDVKVLMKIIMR